MSTHPSITAFGTIIPDAVCTAMFHLGHSDTLIWGLPEIPAGEQKGAFTYRLCQLSGQTFDNIPEIRDFFGQELSCLEHEGVLLSAESVNIICLNYFGEATFYFLHVEDLGLVAAGSITNEESVIHLFEWLSNANAWADVTDE